MPKRQLEHAAYNPALLTTRQQCRVERPLLIFGGAVVWEDQQQVAPLIASLYAKAETIRQAEIERSMRRWPGAGESERKRLEALTEAIINRLLHQAILHLKSNADRETVAHYAAMLQELFALDTNIE